MPKRVVGNTFLLMTRIVASFCRPQIGGQVATRHIEKLSHGRGHGAHPCCRSLPLAGVTGDDTQSRSFCYGARAGIVRQCHPPIAKGGPEGETFPRASARAGGVWGRHTRTAAVSVVESSASCGASHNGCIKSPRRPAKIHLLCLINKRFNKQSAQCGREVWGPRVRGNADRRTFDQRVVWAVRPFVWPSRMPATQRREQA
jgi:hypothetical protein